MKVVLVSKKAFFSAYFKHTLYLYLISQSIQIQLMVYTFSLFLHNTTNIINGNFKQALILCQYIDSYLFDLNHIHIIPT